MSKAGTLKLGFNTGYWAGGPPPGAADAVAEAERLGFDSIWTAEAYGSDCLTPLAWWGAATERLKLGTAIVQLSARQPAATAMAAMTMDLLSGGRFILGLGSQIKPHIERRFSMPWSRPAARMRELIAAIKHIWDAWDTGAELNFRGDFYTHTLMPPFFNPGPNPYGHARIVLAAVGEQMTETAGAVADGIMLHAFTTPRFLHEVSLPAVARGLASAGRSSGDFEVCAPTFVVTGRDEQEIAAAKAATQAQLAFYGSTPSYRPVLDLHGWGALQDELHALSKQGQWERMGDAVTDEVFEEMVVTAEPEEVGAAVQRRCDTIAQRVSFYAPYKSHPETWRRVMSAINL